MLEDYLQDLIENEKLELKKMYGVVDRKIELLPNPDKKEFILVEGIKVTQSYLDEVNSILASKGIASLICTIPQFSHLDPNISFQDLSVNFLNPFLVNNDQAHTGEIVPNEQSVFKDDSDDILFCDVPIKLNSELKAVFKRGEKVFLKFSRKYGLQYVAIPEYLALQEFENLKNEYHDQVKLLKDTLQRFNYVKQVDDGLAQKYRLDQLGIPYRTGYKVNFSGLSRNSKNAGQKSNSVIHLLINSDKTLNGDMQLKALCGDQKGNHYWLEPTPLELNYMGVHCLSLYEPVTCKACLIKIEKMLRNSK